MNKAKANRILQILKIHYPDAKITLEYSNNFELLLAVILSAQTTDAAVNKVAEKLFQKYKGADERSEGARLRAKRDKGGSRERQEIENFANAKIKELEKDIKSIGLYKTKAKNIKRTASLILEKFNGKVPNNMEDLLKLPGVGRKTANVVLAQAFGKTEGIAVDTHVKRLALLFGFSKNTNPLKIEKDLMKLFEKKDWPEITTLLIAHGRKYRKNPLSIFEQS